MTNEATKRTMTAREPGHAIAHISIDGGRVLSILACDLAAIVRVALDQQTLVWPVEQYEEAQRLYGFIPTQHRTLENVT